MTHTSIVINWLLAALTLVGLAAAAGTRCAGLFSSLFIGVTGELWAHVWLCAASLYSSRALACVSFLKKTLPVDLYSCIFAALLPCNSARSLCSRLCTVLKYIGFALARHFRISTAWSPSHA